MTDHTTRVTQAMIANLNAQMEALADDTTPSSIMRDRGLVWLEGWFDISAALYAAVRTPKAELEPLGWDWLTGMVDAICDEDPSDIAYSADQMVDAFIAGSCHRQAAEAEAGAREAALLSLLTKAVGDISAALELADKASLIAKWTVDYVAAINAHDATNPPSEGASDA